MLRIGRIAFVAGSLVAAAAFGQGELFGQIAQSPPQTTGGPGIFANTEGACHLSGSPIFAEDFSFVEPAVVSAVRWWGWAADDCSLDANRSANDGVTSFIVSLYENLVVFGKNVPGGEPIWTSPELDPATDVAIEFFATAMGTTFLGIEFDADVYQYTLVLPPLPAFTGKTWVSISAKTSSSSSWVWVLQGTGETINPEFGTDNERAKRDELGNWTNTLSLGLAFAVLSSTDSDGDGLDDATEFALRGTYPCLSINNPDSDGDGLLDGFEVNELGTSPCNADTNGNGIPDGIDPFPVDPATTSELTDYVQEVSDAFLVIATAGYAGPNTRAQSARQKVLAARMDEAASLISQGLTVEALDVLNSVLDRVDNDSSPPDWLSGSDREAMEILVFIAIFNLSL